MPDRQPRYVLSRRAAEALRPLLQAGTRLDARQRQIRDAGDGGRRKPVYLECRLVPGTDPQTGDPTSSLRVFVGPGANYPPSIRINGKPAGLAVTSTDVDAEGWMDLGDAASISALWLVPQSLPASNGTYYEATNQGTQVVYAFDTTGTTATPGASPTGAPNADWPRWLHPIFVCAIHSGSLVQGVLGGADISIELGDGDYTHSGTGSAGPGIAGGFCSVEQNGLRQLQLYDFRTGARVHPTSGGMGEYDLVLRQCDGHGEGQSPSRAIIRYMVLDELLDYLRTQWGDDFAAWLAAHAADLLDILAAQNTRDHGPFWGSGGDHTTCYGTDIADMVGSIVIDLSNRVLQGAWKVVPGAGNPFQVDGDLDVTGQISTTDLTASGDISADGNLDVAGQIACSTTVSTTELTASSDISAGGNLDVTGNAMVGGRATVTGNVGVGNDLTVGGDADITGNASIGGNATVGGDASAANLAASSDVTAGGQLSGATLKVGGTVFSPRQITLPDGTSLTVLAS